MIETAAPPTPPSPPSYSPGLEGVIAGESAICQVNPEAGLLYRGYDIESLAPRASFEKVAWLLLEGELPTETEIIEFHNELTAASALPVHVASMLHMLPRTMHPMDAVRTGISMLAGWDPDLADNSSEANVRKAVRIVAKLSTLTTAFWRIANGKEPIPPDHDLGHAANFLYCLTGKEPEDWQVRALDTMMNLYAEHEYNASTFAARVTASTLADVYCAITSAIGALKGPLHGGANEDALRVLDEIGTPENAGNWVQEKLAKKAKIAGFGHRVYKKGDSRVPAIRNLAREVAERAGDDRRVRVCEALENEMAQTKGLYANADLYAAPLFHQMGIPVELNTPIFACARSAGWCAHVNEQHERNRLIRPRCIYKGHAPRAYTGGSNGG